MITSPTNPRVKNLAALIQKARTRKQQDVFVATLNEMGIQMEMTQTKALSPETLMERFLSEEPLNDSRATVEKEEGTKVKSRTLYESAKALVGLIRAL